MPMNTDNKNSNSYCEAYINGKWTTVHVQTGINRPGLTVRCGECHGPIVLMRVGRNNTTRAHAEHRPGHTGCSRGHYFDGKRMPHPQQVPAPSHSEDNSTESDVAIEDDESSFPEGREKFKLHRSFERDGKIVRRAKARRLREKKELKCDVCDFDFVLRYGDELGHGFIEAHHKTPVSLLDGIRRTRIEDLALVCSNCHRMLHRGKTLLTVEQLKTIFGQNNLDDH